MLIGYGTLSANAMSANAKQIMLTTQDIPIKVVIFGPHNRCRYTLYFMNKTTTRYYDNSTHFSLCALYELHLIYLNAQRQTEYVNSKQRIVDESLIVSTNIRLMRLMVEEHGIQSMQREEKTSKQP